MNTDKMEARIQSWLVAARRAGTDWIYSAFPRLAFSTLEIDAAGLGPFEIPQLFARGLKPFHPSMNDDLLDLFGHADRVLANRFDFLQGLNLPAEEFDWEGSLDTIARAQLHAFDYALDLASAYFISRQEKYSRHLHFLVAAWIAANPPGLGTGWLMTPLARRIRNWILAADLVREEWSGDPEFLDILGRSIALQSSYLCGHSLGAESLQEALEVCRALLFPSKCFNKGAGQQLQAAALQLLVRCLEEQVLSDGGAADSQPIAQFRLISALAEIVALHSDLPVQDMIFIRSKLRESLRFLEGILLPDGSLPLFGVSEDSAAGLADFFALSAALLDAPELKCLAGKFGIFPQMLLGEAGKERFEKLPSEAWKPDDSYFPISGFYRLMGAPGSGLVINAVARRAPGEHQDFLSYELLLEGQRAIVDSGACAPTESLANDYFRQARAHNVLLVDNRGAQESTFSPAVRTRRGACNGIKGLMIENSGFGFLGLQHQRAWFYLEGRAWVILDRLEGAGNYHITNLVHLYPTFQASAWENRVVAQSRALGFTIWCLSSSGRRFQITRGSDADFPGWYAPDPGVKYPSAVVRLESDHVSLPWMGGFIIVAGQDAEVRDVAIDSDEGSAFFELCGGRYSLSIKKPDCSSLTA